MQPTEKTPICLIRPPTLTTEGDLGVDATPPLGLAYLASSLEKAGYNVLGIDGVGEAVLQYTVLPDIKGGLLHGLLPEQIIERIPKNTEVIGVTCMFSSQWPYTKKLIASIRSHFQNALIIIGGEHVTSCPEYILKSEIDIDVCVLGEGEETLVHLLEAYFSGNSLETVPGLCIRKGEITVRTAYRDRILQIDEIPEPNWNIFPIEEYIDNAFTHGTNLGRSMPIMASRGCPYSCTFCSSPQMWTTRWKARAPQAVVNEMQKYIEKYKVTNFDFYDLTAIVKRDWIIEFCNLIIKNEMEITWQLPSGTRSEVIDSEVCKLLYTSGCRNMSYAPESGSEPELKRIKKRVNLDKMIQSMKDATQIGIQVKANLIFGMPGSNWGDIFRTFIFTSRMALAGVNDISAFPYSPYPGSELFANLEKEGEIEIGNEFFMGLMGFTDISKAKSYSKHLSAKTLGIICFINMAFFYSLSWLRRPIRILNFIKAILKRESSNRLTFALSHVRHKSQIQKLIKEHQTETVTVKPTFKPKDVALSEVNHL